VEDVLKEFSRIKLATINLEEVPEIAGYLMAFIVPVLVLYFNGKEVLREARIVHLEKFQENIKRIYESI
jgi:thioredoxin-like negative regulator of GroEL